MNIEEISDDKLIKNYIEACRFIVDNIGKVEEIENHSNGPFETHERIMDYIKRQGYDMKEISKELSSRKEERGNQFFTIVEEHLREEFSEEELKDHFFSLEDLHN